MANTYYVPEDCCYKEADDSLGRFPEQAVSLMVSRYDYDLVVRKLKIAIECLEYYGFRMDSGTTARIALEQISKGSYDEEENQGKTSENDDCYEDYKDSKGFCSD